MNDKVLGGLLGLCIGDALGERGQVYRGMIEMPLIESEEYEFIKDNFKIGNTFLLQSASAIR